MGIQRSLMDDFIDKQVARKDVPDQCDYEGLRDGSCTKTPEVYVEFATKPYWMHYCRRHGMEKYKELESAEAIESL